MEKPQKFFQRNDCKASNCDCPPAEDTCKYSERAADEAVRKVFAIMGVNVDDPESVENFRDSLRFGKAMHQAASKGAFAFVSALGAAVLYLIFELITGKHVG